jgi:CHASE2 domain-containing sensor protein
MRIAVQLSANSPWRKVLAAAAIAVISTCLAFVSGQSNPGRRIGEVFYNWFYTQRPVEDRSASSTVQIVVDDQSLTIMGAGDNGFGWPWPRDIWGHMIEYLQQKGAKCVVFDIRFFEKSLYAGELDDDTQFAAALDNAKIPVILAMMYGPSGGPENFAPKVKKPQTFGAANVPNETVIRHYALPWPPCEPPASPYRIGHFSDFYSTTTGRI